MTPGRMTLPHGSATRRENEQIHDRGLEDNLGQAPLAVGRLCALIWSGVMVFSTAWAGTLQGTATYRERIALPADAVFEAELQEISSGCAGRGTRPQHMAPSGQPPFRFAIVYDDAAVQSGHRYTVRATIRHQRRLLFTTDRINPVLDGRNAPLHIQMVSVRGGRQPGSMTDGLGVLPASYEGEPVTRKPVVARGPAARRGTTLRTIRSAGLRAEPLR